MEIQWSRIKEPVFLHGDEVTAYRDPVGHYHNGVFRVYHTQVHIEKDGRYFIYTGMTQSADLVNWTDPVILTPRDQLLNYSSPGNIIMYDNKWMICLQTYPTPENQPFGDQTARIFTMKSNDLIHWEEPEIMMVKGPDVPVDKMGRMIDPYLIQDKDDKSKWWCFYKQNGASISYTHDFKTWTYFGNVKAGENVCILVEKEEYIMFHSPSNGIGVKKSKDLINWTDHGLIILGQKDWPWAAGRLTAGHVLDLRDQPEIGRYVMFFHGSVSNDIQPRETHGRASLALAWSHDLVNWEWSGGV
ncbi:hypothetical protein GF312_22665 [Candidatus Poribacteria bacterium]|nr:hypothetical protein [Candidatus Poribacteria bacterium]